MNYFTLRSDRPSTCDCVTKIYARWISIQIIYFCNDVNEFHIAASICQRACNKTIEHNLKVFPFFYMRHIN